MLNMIYRGIGSLLLAAYAGSALFGWQFESPGKDTIPASVRSSPGGYRSFHFWHSGYHGGK
jgi:hypothetical protein